MSQFRQLDDLVRSAAREPVPQVDWDRVEQRLFERIAREPIRTGSPTRTWGSVFAIAAAAGAIATVSALAASGGGSRADTIAAPAGTTLVSPSHGQPLAAIEASTLHARDRIEAGASSLTIRHPGFAAWNLEPRSVVVVERIGASVQLSLEAGKVRVEVAPGSGNDSFVVRVDDTTVSVHGTVFSVAREGDRAAVQVEQGAVSIGSRGRRGSVASWLMVAPSAGTFSLDGARVAAFSEPSAVSVAQPPVGGSQAEVFIPPTAAASAESEPRVAVPSQPAAGAAGKEPGQPAAAAAVEPEEATEGLPEMLTPSMARSTLDRLASSIADCHRRLRPTRPGDPVQITVHTSLSITVAAEGNVSLGRFNPPLAPDVQACAANALLAARFPAARGVSQLQLPLRF